MAKITPILRTDKENREGTCPIYLRIHAKNKTRYVSLGTRIKKRHWNERTGRVRKSLRGKHKDINALISRRVAEAEREVLRHEIEGERVTARKLKKKLARGEEAPGDYFTYADNVVEGLKREGKIYTHKRYKSVIKKFREYTGEPLPFDELTPELLREYQTHLIEHYGNKQTTVATNFNAIRAILYRAIRDGYASQDNNPFFHFSIKQGKTERERLTKSQLAKIEGLDLPAGSLIWHVRGYFLFMLYGAGIRFGDLAKMKRKNVVGDRLVYRMSKTGHEMNIRLLPKAREILQHYIPQDGKADPEAWLFPILDRYDIEGEPDLVNAISSQNALLNKYLKKIAKRASVPITLTAHVARHSFADIARKSGWDLYDISKALGHSGGLKITERYLAGFDTDGLDDKMEETFGGG